MNQGRKVNTYNIQDNANWIHGKHQIAFGFQTELKRVAPFNDGGILPTYTLGISGNNTTGLTTADLPGIGSSDLTTAQQPVHESGRHHQLGEPDLQRHQHDFGLRSRRHQPAPVPPGHVRRVLAGQLEGAAPTDGFARPSIRVLDSRSTRSTACILAPRLENNNIIQTLLDPNAVLDFIGGPTGTKFYKADKNNFAPNVGLAWDPTGKGKTSVRAGYMIAYANDNLLTAVSNNVITSKGLASMTNLTGLVRYAGQPARDSDAGIQGSADSAGQLCCSIRPAPSAGPIPNLVTPYVQQWTIGIQHEIKGMIFEARYLGNHGTKLLRAFDINQVLYNANGFLADFQRAQSNAGSLAGRQRQL